MIRALSRPAAMSHPPARRSSASSELVYRNARSAKAVWALWQHWLALRTLVFLPVLGPMEA